ncbi:MAG: TlpA disulfide reductase family protein [Myxococcota bacterium]
MLGRTDVFSAVRMGAGLLLLIAAFVWLQSRTPHPLEGTTAPDFSAEILAGHGAESGDRVRISKFLGQPVVLDFWASWCPPCRKSIPLLSDLADRHQEGGLIVLGINVESISRSTVRRFHKAMGARFPTVQDSGTRLQQMYQVTSLPTLVYIDTFGQVRRVESGAPSPAHLEAEVAKLFK